MLPSPFLWVPTHPASCPLASPPHWLLSCDHSWGCGMSWGREEGVKLPPALGSGHTPRPLLSPLSPWQWHGGTAATVGPR